VGYHVSAAWYFNVLVNLKPGLSLDQLQQISSDNHCRT